MTSKSENYLENFVNILDLNVSFLLPYNPTIPVKKNRRPTPKDVKLQVLKNPRFVQFLKETTKNKKERDQKIEEAIETLNEIGFERSFLALRSLGTILYKIMGQAYSAVSVNMTSLNSLKSKMGNRQIIYLPCHRSYADFMLMSVVCFSNDIEVPAIAAGMDFHGMMGMGEMLRKTGAFFMRRSFGSDEFYWRIFMDYMHEVMTLNDFGLEFFVEGTRSRSHKALTPKTGLLSMALEPYFMGELYDVMVVPVAISYEKPMEEQLFVYELLGIPKPKESTLGLIKGIANIKNSNLGKIYFDFCEPITLNEYFGDTNFKFTHAVEPSCVQKLNSTDLKLITNLANQVVREQQKKIVIFSYNLIALAFNECVFTGQSNGLDFNKLKQRVIEYKKFFEILGAIVDVDEQSLDEKINETLKIHSNILKVGSRSEVSLIKSNVNLVNVNPSKLKGIRLANEIMNVAVPTFSIQLYCNPTLFWMSSPAFIVLSLLNENSMDKNALRKEFNFLRKIFIYEFVLYPEFEEEDFEKALNDLKKLDILRTNDGNDFELNNNSNSINILLSAIAPFLNCYLNTSKVILSNFHDEFVEKDVFMATQSHVENSILKGQSDIHPYTLCLDTITMNILSLCNFECLIKKKHNSVNHFTVNMANLPSLVEKLKTFNSKLPFQYKYFDVLISSKI